MTPAAKVTPKPLPQSHRTGCENILVVFQARKTIDASS